MSRLSSRPTHVSMDQTASPHSPVDSVSAAILRTAAWLTDRQEPEGYWCGELEGDSILESEYVLLLAWLGDEQNNVARQAARYLLQQQLPAGGWSLYPGGRLELSASVKAYFALKLTGHDVDSEPLRRARSAIRANGGADRVNSFTRFYLALLGQIEYGICPAVPPEMVLLPAWLPINIYRISAWSRTILVPLSVIWACRPVRSLPKAQGIEELFLEPSSRWPPLRCPRPAGHDRWTVRFKVTAWERLFRMFDSNLKRAERWRLRPFRQAALRAAEEWMIERFEDSDGLGAIFPPIIWSVVALRCLGYEPDSPEVDECLGQLAALIIEEDDAVRLQPCKSPVWDTALSVRALNAAAEAGEVRAGEAINRASQWLLAKEVRRPGDWAMGARAPDASGWFFEHHNAFYPDVDDTIMVMMALDETALGTALAVDSPNEIAEQSSAACQRGLDWIVAMQNRDGGWGAFDRNNDHEFLCHVPFADHNAMIDPSTPDITARVLEAITRFGLGPGDPVVDRAVRFLLRTQESDGSWYGRWGVNYIYGTWQVLSGLAAVGLTAECEAVLRGAEWLVAHQDPDGGWGESPASYEDSAQRGRGTVTPSQTAWALLGLMAAQKRSLPAVETGVDYLLSTQRPDGSWDEPEFTGTGFPLVFYLRYHMYPIYFPLLALSRWQNEAEATGNGLTDAVDSLEGR